MYTALPQEDAADEEAIQAYIREIAETAINNNDITVTVNKESYTEAVAGTSADADGTNGSYKFTITVSDGLQTLTTERITLTIIATPFTGVTDVQAVAAAKSAVRGGTVYVDYGSSQADITAAVQTYIDELLAEVSEAAGVTANVSFAADNEYNVTLSKGSVTDSKTIAMTIVVAPDPDIGTVELAKTAAENALYSAMPQAAAVDEDAINTYIKLIAQTAVSNSDVIITVNKISYTEATAGNSADAEGVNGSYVFTITLSKGIRSLTTEQKTLTITATPYTGIMDTEAVAAAKEAVTGGTVNVAYGANQSDITAAVQQYVNSLLAGVSEAAGVTATVSFISDNDYEVTLSKGSVTDSKTISMTVIESPDPDITIVSNAKTAAENALYSAMTQAAAVDEDAIEGYIIGVASAAVNDSAVTITVNKLSYTEAFAGDPSNPDGTNGSYVFTITVSKGIRSQTTELKTLVITATPYTGISDAEAIVAAKTAIIGGTVNVAYDATQSDITAAVQRYVNRLLSRVSNAAGVTAIVSYAGGNRYNVSLIKGSATDNKTITMTVIREDNSDAGVVTRALTAVENAFYSMLSQATASNEYIVYEYISNTAKAAVNNSDITVTVNRLSYVAPVAGNSYNPYGSDGYYYFTVTVSKGAQSMTTGLKMIVIKATEYFFTLTVVNGDGDGRYSAGEVVNVKADPAADGKIFDKWVTDGGATVSDIYSMYTTIVIPARDITITATYKNKPLEYSNRTISDNRQPVSITGQLSDDADIVVVKISNNIYDISVTSQNGFTGELIVNFDVGVQNNGKLYTVIHTLKNGQRQVFFTRCVNGKISVTVTELSPFEIIEGFNSEYWDNPFIDVTPDQWYYDSVGYVEARGLMGGTGNNSFDPDLHINRAMLVTILYRLEGMPAVKEANLFTDIADDMWYTDAVIWAVQNNIVLGYGNGTFGPSDLLTREQMVTILYRYAVYKGYSVSAYKDVNILAFNDSNIISEYALNAIKWAYGSGIIKGDDAGRLTPKGYCSRAQVASVVHRFCEMVGQ